MLSASMSSQGIVLSLVAAIATGMAGNAFATSPPLPEESGSTVGYDSVAAALADLRTKPSIKWTMVRGWAIATDDAPFAVWSFAPSDYPAYPAVVKRWVTPKGTGSEIHMAVLCEAAKEPCDDLVRTYAKMNGLRLQ